MQQSEVLQRPLCVWKTCGAVEHFAVRWTHLTLHKCGKDKKIDRERERM